MPTTLFDETYDAIWDALDGDKDLVDFMARGKRFKFTGLGDSAIQLRPSDCPALILRPANTGIMLPDNARQSYAFAVEFELTTHKQQWDHIWEYLCRVLGPLMDTLYANLSLTYVRGWKFTSPEMSMGTFGEGADEWAAWVCKFTLTVNIERNARSNGLFTTDT